MPLKRVCMSVINITVLLFRNEAGQRKHFYWSLLFNFFAIPQEWWKKQVLPIKYTDKSIKLDKRIIVRHSTVISGSLSRSSVLVSTGFVELTFSTVVWHTHWQTNACFRIHILSLLRIARLSPHSNLFATFAVQLTLKHAHVHRKLHTHRVIISWNNTNRCMYCCEQTVCASAANSGRLKACQVSYPTLPPSLRSSPQP